MIPARYERRAWTVQRVPLEAQEKLLQWSREALDSLSARVAILDEDGFILETNRAWKEFARSSGIRMRPHTVGINYLTLCERAEGPGSAQARKAAAGIRAVIRGEMEEFVMEYPCHSPQEKSWFNMRVTRLRLGFDGPLGVVVSHENVTNVRQAHITLRRRETELQLQTLKLEEANAALQHQARKLEEANAALRMLLRRHEEDRKEMEARVLSQVKDLIHPHLARLKSMLTDPRQKTLLEIVESNLNDIVSPFAHNLSSRFLGLTPSEIRIAGLIKEGLTSKEISQLLCLAPRTIGFHRENIRRKLGIQGRKVNLRTHLLSLS